MNRVTLIGRLTKDPDVRRGAASVARYTLAVDRKYKSDGQPTADFINIVAFGKNADFVEKYLHKGTKIALTGRIQTGSYTNKDGQKVFTTDVVAEDHEFVEKRESGANQTSNDFMQIPDNVEEEMPFS